MFLLDLPSASVAHLILLYDVKKNREMQLLKTVRRLSLSCLFNDDACLQFLKFINIKINSAKKICEYANYKRLNIRTNNY